MFKKYILFGKTFMNLKCNVLIYSGKINIAINVWLNKIMMVDYIHKADFNDPKTE